MQACTQLLLFYWVFFISTRYIRHISNIMCVHELGELCTRPDGYEAVAGHAEEEKGKHLVGRFSQSEGFGHSLLDGREPEPKPT